MRTGEGKTLTAGAAGNLRQKLERAFGGTKVRDRKRRVGIDDTDERDVRQVAVRRGYYPSHWGREDALVFSLQL